MSHRDQGSYPLLTPAHMAVELAILHRNYPQFRLIRVGNVLAFRGALRSNYGSVFVVDVVLPPLYPEEEPYLRVVSPELPPGTQHIYRNGNLCAHAKPFVAYRTTVATMISVLAGWIYRFERERIEGIDWGEEVGPPGTTPLVASDGTLHFVRRKVHR